MDILALVQSLAMKYPVIGIILTGLGLLVVLGQAIVLMTPTQKDDAVLDEIEKGMFGKVLDFLKSFAPIQKK